ncbi:GSCFA domain-containing protein [Paracoccus sp. YIM 132242]|uniref:GSCFA domain-containing protein n=2 Tax=Paracoccus lichenicola TaxID=2665644 RepID=A0A6L6HRH1_9RHOB|nr:GSCFA domain-containing protein [Paracoccus lichenicola]
MVADRDAPRQPGDTPYRDLPETAFWTRSVARVPADQVAPLNEFPFRIGANDKVATAGSCFAQHIARHLAQGGYNYYIAEQPHPALGQAVARDFGYGTFSARYANIYTSRQLLQLVQRAEGMFVPVTDVWDAPDGRSLVDPFRPAIQPGGYASAEEVRADRNRHLAAVRRMLREMDVFVFTLGLTEAWVDRRDGAVFPLCPGVSGGRFDPAIHDFLNLSIDDVRDDLDRTFRLLRAIRPDLRIILTVSPVPLKATASGDHVLAATTYSKSVLRVAAHDMAATHENVGYFPSYEIIAGNFNRGAYYAEDLREVRPEGVSHVMRTFFAHVVEGSAGSSAAADHRTIALPSARSGPSERDAARLECEEELLEFDRVMAARRNG